MLFFRIDQHFNPFRVSLKIMQTGFVRKSTRKKELKSKHKKWKSIGA